MSKLRREILEAIANEPVSGPALAASFEVSRAAVWKHIESLREAGFDIESSTDGYQVRSVPEYGADAIALRLDAPYRVIERDRPQSTNDVARELAQTGERDVVVIADEQPSGRGRRGRSWVGPAGGIYLSVVTEPRIEPRRVPRKTIEAALATVVGLQAVDCDPAIKWPNDVHLDGRKVAGVLTEMEGEADRVHWVIVGIGINANVPVEALPPDATSLRAVQGSPVDRRTIVQTLIRELDRLESADDETVFERWRTHATTIGRRVRISTPTKELVGRAVDIEPPGALVVETDGGTERVHAGDCEHLRPADP